MDDLYPSRKEMRFTGFDYRAKGCYFITVVVHNHVCLFGHVEDGKMILNDAGKMIDHLYHTVEDRFPQVVCMDSVVMPNHFHCVFHLDVDNSDSIYKIMDYFPWYAHREARLKYQLADMHQQAIEPVVTGYRHFV